MVFARRKLLQLLAAPAIVPVASLMPISAKALTWENYAPLDGLEFKESVPGNIIFYTDGTERMRISADGRVLCRDPATGAMFDVASHMREPILDILRQTVPLIPGIRPMPWMDAPVPVGWIGA